MYLGWKLSVLLLLCWQPCKGSDAIEQEESSDSFENPQPQSQLYPTVLHSKSRNNICNIEVPTVDIKRFSDAKIIRRISSRMTLIEICCPGYRLHKDRKGNTTCMPICENCLNSHCIRPGECECFDGYVKNDSGHCVFTCPISCQNGQCYLDGTCKCRTGFRLDDSKKFCRPICSQGCLGWMNNCTAPGVCGCSAGYTLRNGECMEHRASRNRTWNYPVPGPLSTSLLHGTGLIRSMHNVCKCKRDFTFKNGICHSECDASLIRNRTFFRDTKKKEKKPKGGE